MPQRDRPHVEARQYGALAAFDHVMVDHVLCRRWMEAREVRARLLATGAYDSCELGYVAKRLSVLHQRGVIAADVDPAGVRPALWRLAPEEI